MTDLLYAPADNLGGLHLIRFVPVVGLQPTPATGRPTVVQFLAGFRWLNAYCSPFSGRYDEESNETDNGTVYSVTVEGFWPGAGSDADRLQLDELTRHRFVVEATDLSGSLRLIGTTRTPLTFIYKFRTGTQPGDRRGYVLSWTGQLMAPPTSL